MIRGTTFRLPPKKIVFTLEKITAGALVTESKPSAENHGIILDTGIEAHKLFKKGEKIVAAMWGVEHAKIADRDYYFIDCDHRALLCSYE